ncbi:TadE/TadG family type IV pilus assembly protein [Sphingomonas sp. 3-13AW]|uniref:TadE/TadG family type IV pilus assembly protein n=1 Tax=Sphingomonas sp. 3-13AW TaxID=3050450 RepID=UPI003BB73D89
MRNQLQLSTKGKAMPSVFLCRLRRDRRGLAAVEFALLALPLFLLIMAGIEFGFMMFSKARLSGTLQQAARMATTGDDANGADGAKIDEMVRSELRVTTQARVDVEKSYYDSFDQVRVPEEKNTSSTNPPYCWTDVNANQRWDVDPGRSGLGGPNDIVNYKVTLTYPVLFPLLTKTLTGSSEIILRGQSAMQNEPFGGGKDQAPKQCCISAAMGNPVTCKDL